ncbi:hypothetical protein ASPFODRAFT_65906 [Aspergillus luchuensis CBS 106.47]|uniref:FAD dependent oxidoreductase domain-containing protein n=1 Tax=Aspergillus luchuensis (strain CBS 106.47) TaxID=1137211 RepID=A0A1M3T0J3_ASPLC|nr:hypothetical protein ASPFODRAFT_65906 [Aspergillus luchuensis CBS 106.47]
MPSMHNKELLGGGHATVIGAGIIGLSCASSLADVGLAVTIIARNLPGDKSSQWSSPWAGALLSPHPDASCRAMLEESTARVTVTEYYDDRAANAPIWYEKLFPDFCKVIPSSLPTGATLGFSYTGLVVDPNVFLPWMTQKLRSQGVKFVQRELLSLEQLEGTSSEGVLINASGLGAGQLARDDKVIGTRGQTMFVRCNYDRAIIYQGSKYNYVIPRKPSGGVILGGVSQPGDTTIQVDQGLRKDILDRVNRISKGAFEWVDLSTDVDLDIVGLRPAREGGLFVERKGSVVHAYGAGAWGYVYSLGVAKRVQELAVARDRSKI